MTFEQTAQLLLTHPFKFASTMPRFPHWYTLREKWRSEKEFEEVVKYIRAEGYDERFFTKTYRMFNLNGFKYWTMGAPLEETILINQAKVFYDAEYDRIAREYDTMWSSEEAKKEDEDLFSSLETQIEGRVLDVGCGTGLLLDYLKPQDYLGIDPSQGMLDILNGKHPEAKVINCRAEDFYDEQGFDTIVSLYGSPASFSPIYGNATSECSTQEGR